MEIQEFINQKLDTRLRAFKFNEQPYFFAQDVAEALEYANPSNLYNKIDKANLIVAAQLPEYKAISDNKRLHNSSKLLNQFGILEAVFASKKPEAIVFRKWVLEEVLPAIIQHGGYVRADATADEVGNLKEHLIIDCIKKGSRFQQRFVQLYQNAHGVSDFATSIAYIIENTPGPHLDYAYHEIVKYIEELRENYRKSDEYNDLEHILLLQVVHNVNMDFAEFLRRSRGQQVRRTTERVETPSKVIATAKTDVMSSNKGGKSPARKGKISIDGFLFYLSLFENGDLNISVPVGVNGYRKLRTLKPDSNDTNLLGFYLVYDYSSHELLIKNKK